MINFSEDQRTQFIIAKLNSENHILSDVIDISNGCKPYQVGYGKNLSGSVCLEADVKNRIYHAKEKLNETYLLELKGKHIDKYFIKHSDDYIKWGPWLMSPKEGRYFFQKKLLVRQIIGKTFIGSIDNTEAVADQTLYIGIPHNTGLIVSLEYLLGIINSKLYGFYFRKYYSEEDELFPKIKVNELKKLPIKIPSKKIEQAIANLVTNILYIKNSDPRTNTLKIEEEIDQLVYDMYCLTEEEIKVIEESVN